MVARYQSPSAPKASKKSTKTSDTWEHVAAISSDWFTDAGGVASDLADALERKFGVERMIDGSQYPNHQVFVKADKRVLEEVRAFVMKWLAGHSATRRSHATKKSAAQLQREIDEALATKSNENLDGILPARYRKRFSIKLQASGDSGWINDHLKGTGGGFRCFQSSRDPSGWTVAFDFPGALPEPVKASIRAYCQARHALV